MNKGWQTKMLGDFCTFTSGGTPSKNNPRFWIGDVPFVSARDLKSDRIESAFLQISSEAVQQSATKLAPVGSLLMLVRGMGLANGIQIGEVTAPVAFNQDIRAISPPRESVLPRFLLLGLKNSFLNGKGERVLSSAAHGTLKIDADVLRQIAIPIPSLPEQQRIVGILDEAFDGIATAKASAEKNLQNARALFENYLQSVFTHGGKGGSEKPLAEICTFSSGGTPPKEIGGYWIGEIPWVSGRDMKSTRLSDSYLHISQSAVEETSARIAPKGSLLILVRGMGLAHGAQIAELLVPCSFNQDIKAIHAKADLIPRYLLFALRDRINSNQKVLSNAAHGTLKIDTDQLKSLMIPILSLKDQQRAVTTIDALQTETRRLEALYARKLAALDELKTSLLHQAFSGQL